MHLFAAPLLFTVIYAYMSMSTVPVFDLYLICLGIYLSCSGVAYVVSIATTDARSLVITTGYIAICTLIGGFSDPVRVLEASIAGWVSTLLPRLTYAHWAIEAFYIGAVEPYRPIYDVEFAMDATGIDRGEYSSALVVPILMGVVWRAIALVLLVVKGSRG
jgi:hypothetical protein